MPHSTIYYTRYTMLSSRDHFPSRFRYPSSDTTACVAMLLRRDLFGPRVLQHVSTSS